MAFGPPPFSAPMPNTKTIIIPQERCFVNMTYGDYNKERTIALNSASRDAANLLSGTSFDDPDTAVNMYIVVFDRIKSFLLPELGLTVEEDPVQATVDAFPGAERVDVFPGAPTSPPPVVPVPPPPPPALPSAPSTPAPVQAPVATASGASLMPVGDPLWQQLFHEIVSAGGWQGDGMRLPSFYINFTYNGQPVSTPHFKHQSSGTKLWVTSKFPRKPAEQGVDENLRALGIVQ